MCIARALLCTCAAVLIQNRVDICSGRALFFDPRRSASVYVHLIRDCSISERCTPSHLFFRVSPVAYCADVHSLPEALQERHLKCVRHPIVADNMHA